MRATLLAAAAAVIAALAGCYGPLPDGQDEAQSDGPATQSRAVTRPSVQRDPGAGDPQGGASDDQGSGAGRDPSPDAVDQAVQRAARTAEPQPMPWQPGDSNRSPHGQTGGDGDSSGDDPSGSGSTTPGGTLHGGVTTVPATGGGSTTPGVPTTPAAPPPTGTCGPGTRSNGSGGGCGGSSS